MVLQWNYCNLPFNMIIAKKKKGLYNYQNQMIFSWVLKWKLMQNEN